MDNSKLENIEAIAFLTLISINGMVLSTSQAIIRTCSSASLITSFYCKFACNCSSSNFEFIC